MKIMVTGGAGFIGSALIRHILSETAFSVVNVDKLTYASNLHSLSGADASPHYFFEQVDICNTAAIADVFYRHRPDAVMHLAAESHVDRSIDGPVDFIQTNIVGTFTLLEQARQYWQTLDGKRREMFRFVHVSTDEVYGDLEKAADLCTEATAYAPSSPYSASKASSDHLVRAWHRTYGLPTLVTNCSNNYGPYQFPEKLIPKSILNALQGRSLPIYGDGAQIRDWLYVDDHARALMRVLTAGLVGETYNIGGHNEVRNIQVVETICNLLEQLVPQKPAGIDYFRDLIEFVEDRPGHDTRYAIDASKIHSVLDWAPKESFDSGIRKTVVWYLNNPNWWCGPLDSSSRGKRIGLSKDE